MWLRSRQQACDLIHAWVAAHGTKTDDKAFVAWIEQVFPAPPAALAAEMPVVVALDKTRTAAGIAAATWLEAYGKKDIWKLYVHDQKEVLDSVDRQGPQGRGEGSPEDVQAGGRRPGRQVRLLCALCADAVLRTDHTVTPGQKCPCSYPSRHAAAGAASRTVLGTLMPDRAAQYRATEAQIDYSRIYMAGHFPGDIRAGALLGDVIGDYFLITRNGIDQRT